MQHGICHSIKLRGMVQRSPKSGIAFKSPPATQQKESTKALDYCLFPRSMPLAERQFYGRRPHVMASSWCGMPQPPSNISPYSKVRGAKMGPTWVLSAPGGPHISPMLAPYSLLSGNSSDIRSPVTTIAITVKSYSIYSTVCRISTIVAPCEYYRTHCKCFGEIIHVNLGPSFPT